MNKRRRPWSYRNVFVEPAKSNSSGIRWTALFPGFGFLKADTKAGMRDLITGVSRSEVQG